MNKNCIVRAVMLGCAFATSLTFLPSFAVSADVPTGIWDRWDQAAKQQCPSHHLELLGDVYDELVDSFVQTLPQATENKVVAIADYSRRCADETAGFYCEMAVNLDAFEKLGLFRKFTAFTCHRYKCLDGAYCVNPRTGKLL